MVDDSPSVKPARLVDIAREVGVSRAVVGHVLLNSGSNIRVGRETAERIRKVALRLDYRPNQIARQLTGAASGLIGVLVNEALNQASQRRLWATEVEARRQGYRVLIGQIGPDTTDTDEYLRDFESHNVEAVLYLGTNRVLAARLAELDRAISSVRPKGRPGNYVELDRAEATRLAVQHLLERGRKRIGLIMPPLSDDSGYGPDKRRGFLEALADHGLTYGPKVIAVVDRARPSQSEGIDRAVEKLVIKGLCDAVVTTADRWAVALVKALKHRGLSVPGDVAVVGFDNLDIATAVDPELTTIDHSHDACARAMIDLMVELIEGRADPSRKTGIAIPPRLVVRQST